MQVDKCGHAIKQLQESSSITVLQPTRCSPYCLCDVAGDMPFQCRTAVVPDSHEPARGPTRGPTTCKAAFTRRNHEMQEGLWKAWRVRAESADEVWNKTVGMEFSGKDPLAFSVYSKDRPLLNCFLGFALCFRLEPTLLGGSLARQGHAACHCPLPSADVIIMRRLF